MNMMKALLATEVHKVGIREVPIPDIKDDEVLIEVAYAGICASDLHAYNGLHTFRKPPVILGHEVSGTIVKKGPNVENLEIGDMVTAIPVVTCLECEWCKQGKPQMCAKKINAGIKGWVGTFVEYFNAPANWVVKAPKGVDMKTFVLAEPLSVAVHGLNQIPPDYRERLVIIGTGAIGSMAVIAAKAMGFKRIIAVDIDDTKLERALISGAERAVHNERENLEQAVIENFGMEKATGVLITAPHENVFVDAVHSIGIGGFVSTISSLSTPRPFILADFNTAEATLIGSHSYNNDEFHQAVKILSENVEAFTPLVSHVFPKEKIQDAFDLIVEKRETFFKVVMDMKH
ncbi:zinc-dependent alcohol dehydrogenase [Youxingia wuxianensis]|uniref:Alcohol dehydrogenase catalytic domain-containing protein n=1 Tax=Youxingia wuxianensis TaxID=2763678 RepID=A0A926IHZ7_9FIRM|nr:alcohol dehydrogenase catalytic domain-containing protein [Youxingia wuxianensis]MBC8585826.1 alcohol dehydrogenase catalytic domain-containing protein [Youxingia wuxianensis]